MDARIYGIFYPMRKPERVPWTVKVATVFGIPIRLHATLLLLLAWVMLVHAPGDLWMRAATTVAIFFCVVLHELGHSIVAQKLGIQVHQITLYPVGGVAQLSRQPDPKREIWITIAGPLVNLLIALALIPFFLTQEFARTLLLANLILFFFNLLPAFPMDGGRLLRAILGLKLSSTKSTKLAARIGQGMAILLGLVGLATNPWLIVTAFFIFTSAGFEVEQTELKAEAEHLPVRSAMMTELRHVVPGDTLLDAGHLLVQTAQTEFPVLLGDEIVGVLTRGLLVKGMSLHGRGAFVSEVMERDFAVVGPEDNLWELAEGPLLEPPQVVVVKDANGTFLGLVTPDNLTEALLVERLAQRQ